MPAPPTSASYAAATSCLGKNLEAMRLMLANCTAFRTLTGATNEAEALARIYQGCLPPPASNAEAYTLAQLESYRPFAIVMVSPGQAIEYSRMAFGGGNWNHNRRGEFHILIERSHPTSGDDDDNDFAWIDTIGKIVHSADINNPGLIELHERQEYLSVAGISVRDIYRADEEDAKEVGDYQRAHIVLRWGRDN